MDFAAPSLGELLPGSQFPLSEIHGPCLATQQHPAIDLLVCLDGCGVLRASSGRGFGVLWTSDLRAYSYIQKSRTTQSIRSPSKAFSLATRSFIRRYGH